MKREPWGEEQNEASNSQKIAVRRTQDPVPTFSFEITEDYISQRPLR